MTDRKPPLRVLPYARSRPSSLGPAYRRLADRISELEHSAAPKALRLIWGDRSRDDEREGLMSYLTLRVDTALSLAQGRTGLLSELPSRLEYIEARLDTTLGFARGDIGPVAELTAQIAYLEQRLEAALAMARGETGVLADVRQRTEYLEARSEALAADIRNRSQDAAAASRHLEPGLAALAFQAFARDAFDDACPLRPGHTSIAIRGAVVRAIGMDQPSPPLGPASPAKQPMTWPLALFEIATCSPDGVLSGWQSLPRACAWLNANPALAPLVIAHLTTPAPGQPAAAEGSKPAIGAEDFAAAAMAQLAASPDLIDTLAQVQAANLPEQGGTASGLPLPFALPDALPPFRLPAEPKRKSAVFLHNSYYHFNTLAAALRRQGWDALTVSVESPSSPQRQFYVGEDVNLWHADPLVRQRQTAAFLRTIPERFGSLHFYGHGQPSFFSENFDSSRELSRLPWDFLELRRHRVLIGYSVAGCQDGGRQSSIRRISNNVCGRCVWELEPAVCNDARSGAWAQRLEAICDWVCLEGDFAVDERTGPRYVREPVTYCVDPDVWHPDVEVPDTFRIARNPGELFVYHAVGNAQTRRAKGRDIKGSGAVEAAIATLQGEGLPLRLIYATDLHIGDVRYVKAQADIVVDQLNYGRIGANGRESFMMGKPVVTRLSPTQPPMPPLRSVAEAPALDASEATITDVLRDLARNEPRRTALGAAARDFALRWFAADACAQRYAGVLERIREGLPPDSEDLYPPASAR